MVDFLFALIELFYYFLRFRSYEAKYCTARLLSHGSTSLHSNFSWMGSSPATIFVIRKLETVKTASPAFPRFDTIPEYEGQTDGRIDRQTDTALAKLFCSAL